MMSLPRPTLSTSLPATLGLALLQTVCLNAAVSYEKQIVPLWDKYCLDCHGADDADGGLAMDSFAALMKGGEEGVAIVAGKADESLLVKFLEGRSGRGGKNEFMPPGKRDKLTPEEIALVRTWIQEGAVGPASPGGPRVATSREVNVPKVAPKTTPKKAIHALAYSSAAKLLAVGRYGSLELMEPGTQQVRHTLSGFKGMVNAAAFSPDGQTLYAAGGEPGISGEVRAWKVADGSELKTYAGHTDACYALAVSPDGRWLATGAYDQKIRLWDTATGAEQKVLTGHNGSINGLAFRPDGKVLASASADRTVKLWSMPEGNRLDTFSQPLKEQNCVVFSRDGKQLFAGGMDSRIRIWDISPTAKEGSNKIQTSRFAHEGGLLGLCLSSDGKYLASSATDRSLKLWNAAELTEKFVIEKQSDWAPALAFVATGGELFAGRADGGLGSYATDTGKPVATATKKPAAPIAKPVMNKKAAPAKPAKPAITRVLFPALHIGGSTGFSVHGQALDAEPKVYFNHAGIQGQVVKSSVSATKIRIKVAADASLPRGAYEMWIKTAQGETPKVKVYADDLTPQISQAADFLPGPRVLAALPASVWGVLTETGQQDVYRFKAKAGEELVFDLAVQQISSSAKSPRLEILDESLNILSLNRGLDAGSDPFIAWKAPREGSYLVRVSNTTLDGSPAHLYRLTAGELPYVTGWSPLAATAGKDTKVTLIGHHLKAFPAIPVKPGSTGLLPVPPPAAASARFRVNPVQQVSELAQTTETEPNETVASAQLMTLPGTANGILNRPAAKAGEADTDCYAFEAKKGQTWIIETLAAMVGSPADTKIELLDAQGKPVPRLLLQAVRDSYNNFRSVDANNPDIRLQNWEEMALNEYVYFNGDVMKTFRMPRGPDSGFLFYANDGKRQSYFDTSATAHALDEACYTVVPHPLGTALIPNGLPVFTLFYANDDEGTRRRGRDSQITFTVPEDGRYVVKVTDTRGLSGPRLVYALSIRQPKPDFKVAFSVNRASAVAPGSSLGFSLRCEREDGFDGPIRAELTGLPPGFIASSPVVIEAGHNLATGSLHALPGAKAEANWSKFKITAAADIAQQKVSHEADGLPFKPALAPEPKFIVRLEQDAGGKPKATTAGSERQELVLAPGQSVKAWIRVERKAGFNELISFDVHNLPHGVIIDDIGLNGVQVRAGETERPIEFRCDPWVQEQDRLCHVAMSSARAEQDSSGLVTSSPVLLKIRKPGGVAAAGKATEGTQSAGSD